MNQTIDIVISVVIVAAIAIAIIIGLVNVARKAKIRAEQKTREVNEVEIKHGVRYTPDATIVDKQGNETVSYVKGDIVLKPKQTLVVGKHADIQPGKWTVLASNEGETTFNIRIGQYVKEYKHGQELILVEGDEICPTSSTIILR